MAGPGSEDLEEARAKRLAQLEAKLSKPPSVGVVPPVAALALVGALGLLFMQRQDFEYFFSPKEPLELGAEGNYHFEVAQSNRYAQVHGTPTVRGAYWLEQGSTLVAIGLRDTPLMVRRATLPSENWRVGTTPPQPDQRTFSVRGRLLSRADASKLGDAFSQLETWGEVHPAWVLLAEERPGGNMGTMAWLAGLTTFAAVNAWLLLRGLLSRRTRRQSTAASSSPE